MSDIPPPPPAGTTPLPPPSETPPPPPAAPSAPIAALMDPVSASESDPSLPPPAALKPLLNPLQAEGSAPQSTIVEAAQSPNPANPAADDQGRNVELPPTVASTPAPADTTAAVPNGVEGGVAVDAGMANGIALNAATEPAGQVTDPLQPGAPAVPAPSDNQPPLPIDAPVPPSPPAPKDEIVPSLPASAIPSAVPTPTVIAVESPAIATPPIAPAAPSPAAMAPASATPAEHVAPPASEQPAAPEPTPAATPAPATAVSASLATPAPAASAATASSSPAPFSAPAPAPAASAPLPASAPVPASGSLSPPPALPSAGAAAAQAGSDGMDLDADGEGEEEVSAPVAAPNSLKRAGDELSGPDEKRAKELNGSASAPVPAAAPPPAFTTTATGEVAPPVAYVPVTYQPPEPRNPGPRTRLTQTQHKYLLNTIRSLKKHQQAGVFAQPVDVVLFGIPHYPNIVKKPMDLGTVETKLIVSNPRGPPKDKSKMGNWDESKGRYHSVAEVTEDVRQVWENTRMFNGVDHFVSQNATFLEAIYEKALKNIPAEPISAAPSPAAPPPSAGPSHVRRPSISQAPAPRRSEDNTDRPKREIHPPPPKELPYTDVPRKPKRRADPQVTWAMKQVSQMEKKNAIEMAPFLYPVGELIRQVDGYARLIKKPIDLIIIKGKIAESEYETPQQIDADMKLMFKNAIMFNPPDHEVHKLAKQMQSAWNERFKGLPPKEVPRGLSEDIGVDEMIAEEVEENFDDDEMLAFYRKQLQEVEAKIAERIAVLRKSQPASTSASKKAKPAPVRKQSTASASKRSPAPSGATSSHGNGHAQHHAPAPAASPVPKKPRKSKDVSYKDDDGGYGESDEEPEMSMTQKQELAEKIQVADGDTLSKAIKIIQSSTGLDGANDEIELDIDTLPPKVVSQLYNLVCRGGVSRRNGPGRPKGQSAVVGGKKPGRKATGGYTKRTMNEQEEAARIARMEAQLQSFDAPAAAAAGGYESESSEEDESEEE